MPSPALTPAGACAACMERPVAALERAAGGRAHPRSRRRRPDDVAEHGAGLDRGQLAGIADEHEPRVGPHRLDEARHQRQRHHRGLVDDDDVVREAVGAIVAKAAVAAGPPAEQAVQRRRVQREQLLADGGLERQLRGLGVHGLLEPGRRLARRRGERDERRRLAARGGLLGEQRDDPRDGRRLARARPARDDRQAAQRRGRGGQPLALVAVAGEQALEAGGEHARVDGGRLRPRRARAGRRRSGAPRASSDRGTGGCPTAAAAGPARRRCSPSATSALRRSAAVQAPTSGHGSSGSATGSSASSEVACSRDRGEIHVDVAEPRPAHGERGRERDGQVVLPAEREQAQRDVDVGGAQHAGVVECPQRLGAWRARRTSWASTSSVIARHRGRGRRSAPRRARRAGARRTRRTGRRRRAACPARSSRARTGTGRRRGCDRGHSRAAASAGSGAARRCTAAPAARSGSGGSRPPAPRAGDARR